MLKCAQCKAFLQIPNLFEGLLRAGKGKREGKKGEAKRRKTGERKKSERVEEEIGDDWYF